MYYRKLSRELRNNATDAERLLWQHLRMRQMGNFKFRRQHPIGNYIVDFICLQAKLVIEIDGGQHYEEEAIAADLIRTKWLEKQGLKILRFSNHDVFTNLDGVYEAIWNELGIDHPLPNPPPKRREGIKKRKKTEKQN